MGDYSGRKAVDGVAASKRGSSIISNRDQNIQLCNRIGCSGRLNPARGGFDKIKAVKSSSGCSEHGNEVIRNSSKVVPRVTKPLIPLRAPRNRSASSASRGNAISDIQKAKVPYSSSSSDSRSVQLDQKKAKSDGTSSVETRSTSAVSNGSTKRTFLKKPSSAVDSCISSRTSTGASKSAPRLSWQNPSATRPGSRYLNCSPVTDILPSESANGTRKQVLKKISERVKQAPTTSVRSGLSISETKQARSSQTAFRDNVSSTSVRARRLNTSTVGRPPHVTRHELPTDQRTCRLPNSQSTTDNPRLPPTFTRSNATETSRTWNLTSPSRVPYSRNLPNREGLRRYNLSGISEMLFALGHMEYHEEMSLERFCALESSFVLGALSFHDQHREMRLDIDNMSYEELLALEERMGHVSTALSEEALAKCIKKSVYKPHSLAAGFSDMDDCVDDTKCSICQEEYSIGDEMGTMHCNHSYHVDCIGQWLRQKNWCPICKSSAAS